MKLNALASLLTLGLMAATATASPFKVASNDFKDGGTLADKQSFNSFGCSGAW